MDRHAALRKAWEGANALRGLWDTADDRTKEWFVGAVLFDSDEAGGTCRVGQGVRDPGEVNQGLTIRHHSARAASASRRGVVAMKG